MVALTIWWSGDVSDLASGRHGRRHYVRRHPPACPIAACGTAGASGVGPTLRRSGRIDVETLAGDGVAQLVEGLERLL